MITVIERTLKMNNRQTWDQAWVKPGEPKPVINLKAVINGETYDPVLRAKPAIGTGEDYEILFAKNIFHLKVLQQMLDRREFELVSESIAFGKRKYIYQRDDGKQVDILY